MNNKQPWEFRFGNKTVTQSAQKAPDVKHPEPRAPDATSLGKREVVTFDVKALAYEVSKFKQELETVKRNSAGTIDNAFKLEVISFFGFLMDAIEKVSGGKFPTKARVIEEMKSRFVK